MIIFTKYNVTLFGVLAAYFAVSKYIFDHVNKSTELIIDELFHIPQGLAYCRGNYSYWDPKITTPPGLYVVSSLILKSNFECNAYNLRSINLVASGLNLLLLSSILKFVYDNNHESHVKIVVQALNIAILPPLYFFSHVYYTDTLSLTFLLAFSRLCFFNSHKMLIFILSICSLCMRQTNIAWIAMVFGHKALDLLIRTSRVYGNDFLSRRTQKINSSLRFDVDKSKVKRYYNLSDAFYAICYHISTCFRTFFKFISFHDMIVLMMHAFTLFLFAYFVYWNGSIVVGDKKAHTAALHIPQLFYFLIFYGIFGLPYVLSRLQSTIKLIIRNKRIVLLLITLMGIIVHFNTIVHPYLLADNRHYTFYVWNRWYGKFEYAKYATIPVYIFLLFSLYDNLKDQNCISFLLPCSVCIFIVLCFQKMIEVRYFIIPYIVLRLRLARLSFKLVIMEFIWYIIINLITFNVFFTKEIYWKDFDYVQRIIW